MQSLDGFQLDDDTVFDNQVQSEIASNSLALVFESDLPIALDRELASLAAR